jgi:hypothetical protein
MGNELPSFFATEHDTMPSVKRKRLLSKDERGAVELAIKALQERAERISERGSFGTKGPFMYCIYAMDTLKQLLERRKE